MKPLEIPYNFDTQLIDFLKIYSIDIHCIYVPPFKEHYKCAKYYYTHDNGIYMGNTFPNTLLYFEALPNILLFFFAKLSLKLKYCFPHGSF